MCPSWIDFEMNNVGNKLSWMMLGRETKCFPTGFVIWQVSIFRFSRKKHCPPLLYPTRFLFNLGRMLFTTHLIKIGFLWGLSSPSRPSSALILVTWMFISKKNQAINMTWTTPWDCFFIIKTTPILLFMLGIIPDSFFWLFIISESIKNDNQNSAWTTSIKFVEIV